MLRFLVFLPFVVTSPVLADEPETYSVLSFNIRYDNPRDGVNQWSNRSDRVIEQLKSEDVFGLQEVLPNQLADLKGGLPDHTFYAVPRTGKPGEKSAGEAVPVGWRTERFRKLEAGTFWLSETPERPESKSWDSSLPRICSWVILEPVGAGEPFLFASVHFDHRGTQARVESAKLLRTRLPKIADGKPIVLVGDFNTPPGTEPLEILTEKIADETSEKRALFHNAENRSRTERFGPRSTWSGFRKIVVGAVIDYIFVTDEIIVENFGVIDTERDGRFSSDHLPVRTRLRFPTATSPEPER